MKSHQFSIFILADFFNFSSGLFFWPLFPPALYDGTAGLSPCDPITRAHPATVPGEEDQIITAREPFQTNL
jgi:hypothetical protein